MIGAEVLLPNAEGSGAVATVVLPDGTYPGYGHRPLASRNALPHHTN